MFGLMFLRIAAPSAIASVQIRSFLIGVCLETFTSPVPQVDARCDPFEGFKDPSSYAFFEGHGRVSKSQRAKLVLKVIEFSTSKQLHVS